LHRFLKSSVGTIPGLGQNAVAGGAHTPENDRRMSLKKT
jgi:hypothetical protein